MMLVQHHESAYFTSRCIDSFERLYREGEGRAKIMAIAIHPYISGQPHRIKYLEAVYDRVSRFPGVLHWNGAERRRADLPPPYKIARLRDDSAGPR
jgi:allantoinase